jgi:hypothetical protein
LIAGDNTGLISHAKALGDWFEDVGEWFVAKMRHGVSTSWSTLDNLFRTKMDDLSRSVQNQTHQFEAGGADLAREFGQGVFDNWDRFVIQKLQPLFDDLGNVMSGGTAAATQAARDVMQQLPDIVQTFKELSQGDRLDELMEQGAAIMTAVGNGIREGANVIKEQAREMATNILGAILWAWKDNEGQLNDRAATQARLMFISLQEVLSSSEFMPSLLGEMFVNGIIEGMKSQMMALRGTIYAVGSEMVTTLKGALLLGTGDAAGAQQLETPIDTSAVEQALTELRGITSQFGALSTDEQLGQIKTSASAVVDSLVEGLSGGEARVAGVIKTLRQAWLDGMQDIRESSTDVGQVMVEAIMNIIQPMGPMLGQSFIEGIIAGINSRTGALFTVIQWLAQDMVEQMQGAGAINRALDQVSGDMTPPQGRPTGTQTVINNTTTNNVSLQTQPGMNVEQELALLNSQPR